MVQQRGKEQTGWQIGVRGDQVGANLELQLMPFARIQQRRSGCFARVTLRRSIEGDWNPPQSVVERDQQDIITISELVLDASNLCREGWYW